METLADLILWLAAGGAAIGAVSSLAMQLLKKVWHLEGDKAFYISMLVAVLLSALAQAASPYVGEIPAWINDY